MNETINVLSINGSLRNGSYNRMLLNAAKELAPGNMAIEEFKLNEIPLYNSDFEKERLPESVLILKDKISKADGLLISTPEYNYSVTGALKNAIDWASRPPASSPLKLKPVAILGGSGGMSGTIRAQSHLRQIFVHSNIMDMKKPEVLVTKIHEKFDAEGKLTDETLKEHIIKFMASFDSWIKLFKKTIKLN